MRGRVQEKGFSRDMSPRVFRRDGSGCEKPQRAEERGGEIRRRVEGLRGRRFQDGEREWGGKPTGEAGGLLMETVGGGGPEGVIVHSIEGYPTREIYGRQPGRGFYRGGEVM